MTVLKVRNYKVHKGTKIIKNSLTVLNLHFGGIIGVRYLENEKRWINRDLGNCLKHYISTGGHIMTFVKCLSDENGKEV